MLIAAFAAVLAAVPVYATGVFKLVGVPGTSPQADCDVYTRLILDRAELTGPIAFLSQRYQGNCTEPLDRAARHYPLFHLETDSCGSEIWQGDFLRAGRHHVKVTDHRTRICDDAVLGTVIVEETAADGAITTLYATP